MLILKWLCTQRSIVPLWSHIGWRALHSSWPEPSRQHDIVEYFTHLRPLLGAKLRFGSWESRQVRPEGVLSNEEGHTWPLLIPASLPGLAAQHPEPLSMQSLVDRWSSAQVGLHALVSEPPAILIQICRFPENPSSIGIKVFHKLEPEPYIMLPAFANPLNHDRPLELQYRRYCRVATLLHEGNRLLAGHYRAVLHDPQHGDFITNDSGPAQRVGPGLTQHVQSNSYAFIYKHCPEMPQSLN